MFEDKVSLQLMYQLMYQHTFILDARVALPAKREAAPFYPCSSELEVSDCHPLIFSIVTIDHTIVNDTH